MNAARRLGTRLGLAAVVAMALGALTMAGSDMAAQEEKPTGPYYFIEGSKCEDPCPGLSVPYCRCYVFPPIVVKAPPKN